MAEANAAEAILKVKIINSIIDIENAENMKEEVDKQKAEKHWINY